MTASVRLGELVLPVQSREPTAAETGATFKYIDLSAVSQEFKTITGARDVVVAGAPSRARQVVADGDVLVSTVRPNLNAVAQVGAELADATASTGFCVLRPIEGQLDSRYLLQWVKTAPFVERLTRLATGASYPAVTDRIVLDSSIPLPPLAEQRRIADILDRADAMRAKRREALALLESLAPAAFAKMFGDPASNPTGWPRASLGDVVLSASDGPHVSPEYADAGVPFLSTRHIRRGEIVWEDLKYLTIEDAETQWRKCRPARGDLLYTKGGSTGLAAVVPDDRQFAVWVHVALLKPDRTIVDSTWLAFMLNSAFCYQQSQVLTHGIANRDLGLKRMVRIRLYLPPLDLQREFAARVAAIDELKAVHRASLTEMDALFASLQHGAFRGEL